MLFLSSWSIDKFGKCYITVEPFTDLILSFTAPSALKSDGTVRQWLHRCPAGENKFLYGNFNEKEVLQDAFTKISCILITNRESEVEYLQQWDTDVPVYKV